jgi:hypothetical protein
MFYNCPTGSDDCQMTSAGKCQKCTLEKARKMVERYNKLLANLDYSAELCADEAEVAQALLDVAPEPKGCMYPICTCYGERTPYACEGDPCRWWKCDCAAPKPVDGWAKCQPAQRSSSSCEQHDPSRLGDHREA